MKESFSPQAGKGNIGCLFTFLILAVAGYLGYKFIPHVVSYFELKDAASEIAVQYAARLGRPDSPELSTIQGAVYSKAQQLQIPLKRQDIQVTRDDDRINITVHYLVVVDLPRYPYEVKFNFAVHN